MPESFAGKKVHDFFSTLVAKKFATPYTSAHRGARLYHLQGKTLYSAVGEPDNRNRRPATLARAIERLMLLDAVLAEGSLRWLGTEREKVGYFQRSTAAARRPSAVTANSSAPTPTSA